MAKRTLTFTILLMGAFGCSSSSNTPADGGPKDGSTKKDGGDAAVTEGGGDTADKPADTAAGETSADGSVDAALTPLQARGEYLVNTVIACPDCHTPRKADGSPDMTKFLAGNASFIVVPPNGDKLPSRNLTNDETGLKNRTDAEIKDMFMNGKRPLTKADGGAGTEALNPVMPYYVFHNLTSGDADAIVAYLRTVKGVTNEIPRRSASFDVPAPANPLDPNKIPLPISTFPERESALRGRYLAAESGLCVECHTQHQMAADVLDPTKLFQGGEDFSGFFGGMLHPVSKNLTSDPATGLGNWTADDIVKVLKEGKAKDGTGICPPMPVGPMGAYGNFLLADATDIANYIKSLPPVAHLVPDMCVFPPLSPDAGTDGGTDGATDRGAPDASEGGPSDAGSEGGADTASSTDATGN